MGMGRDSSGYRTRPTASERVTDAAQDDNLPPTRLGKCPRCGGDNWGDGSRPCGICEPPPPPPGRRVLGRRGPRMGDEHR
jgi:hypothetical protein